MHPCNFFFITCAFLAVPSLHAQSPDVIRFHAAMENVKATFGPGEAVARLKPGNILEANSLD